MIVLCAILASAPAFAQTQAPGGAPVDRAEANTGSDLPALRIGPATISGSLHADAIRVNHDTFDDYRDQFVIRRARFGVAGNLTPRIGWNLSAEFTATPVLRNAFVQVRFTPFISARLGQSTPLTSIERGTSPTALEFIDRTRLTSQLTYAQDIGASLFNEKPLGGWLNYVGGVINGAGYNRADDNDAKDVYGRVEVLPPHTPHTSLVVSGATGDQPHGRRTRASAGVQVDTPLAKVTAEALREDDARITVRDGFLVTGVYRIRPHQVTPHFRMVEIVGRYFRFNDPLSAVGLPGNIDDDAAAGGTARFVPITTREFQGGANYYATRNVRVMANIVVPVDERTTPGTTLVSRFQVVF